MRVCNCPLIILGRIRFPEPFILSLDVLPPVSVPPDWTIFPLTLKTLFPIDRLPLNVSIF